jgi:hypothetical protein
MGQRIDHTSLHRTAKYFMDSGRVMSHDEAMALLEKFGLTICVGDEVAHSAHHQTALLTLINVARRTLLGGIEVCGLIDCASLTPLATKQRLIDAVRELGGVPVSAARKDWPSALIGNANAVAATVPCWQLTWEGWRGGVVPARMGKCVAETNAIALAPALAAAVCAAEAFSYHAGDHPMAGRRAAGLSLWHPGADWLVSDPTEPALAYLPSRLWIIGLGNLGQAFAWLLATLPYGDRSQVELLLQDFDRITPSNDSTSLLSSISDTRRKKARVVAEWLEARGFDTFLEERRFGPWTRRAEHEPGAALCGVDNALARSALEQAGFGLVVESGLGAGPQAFRSISLHTFPSSRSADEIWSRQVALESENFEGMPAYQALKDAGMDHCGLAQLASRTVGVPFVGLIAGCLVIAEILRRLHGGVALEFASGSVAALEDFECGSLRATPYAYGHVLVANLAA